MFRCKVSHLWCANILNCKTTRVPCRFYRWPAGTSSPPPPLSTAHMKAGAASRGPRQVNSSRNRCAHLLFEQDSLELPRRRLFPAVALATRELKRADLKQMCSAEPRSANGCCTCHVAVPPPRGVRGCWEAGVSGSSSHDHIQQLMAQPFKDDSTRSARVAVTSHAKASGAEADSVGL